MHKTPKELWSDIEEESKSLSATNINIHTVPATTDTQSPVVETGNHQAIDQARFTALATQIKQLDLSVVSKDEIDTIIAATHHELQGNDIGLDMLSYQLCKHGNIMQHSELEAIWSSLATAESTKATLADLQRLVSKYTIPELSESKPDEITSQQVASTDVAAIEPQIAAPQVQESVVAVKPPTAPAPVAEKAVFQLDNAKPLNPSSFPVMPLSAYAGPPAVIQNYMHLLNSYNITTFYDLVKKKLVINIPGLSGTVDNFDNVSIAYLYNLCVLNGMNTGLLPTFITAIADRNQKNPVAEWILSKPWDGIDRLEAFYDTLTERKDFPKKLKETMMLRWSISGVAAILKAIGFKARGVLTLQGPQSIGKSSWIYHLVSDPLLREKFIKLDLHLDPSNKDSIYAAISHWIGEIGELDSTLKKDVARLKGFLTSNMDKIRKPYDRAYSEYQRRTIFAASVNDSNFLVDNTGNTRFWTIPVTKINFNHGIDMQQFWAQIVTIYESGEQWWLTYEEEQELELLNKAHRTVNIIHERIMEVVDLDMADQDEFVSMTASDMLRVLKYDRPTNPQFKECNAAMRELFGEPKRIKGYNKWRVPLRNAAMLKQAYNEDD